MLLSLQQLLNHLPEWSAQVTDLKIHSRGRVLAIGKETLQNRLSFHSLFLFAAHNANELRDI